MSFCVFHYRLLPMTSNSDCRVSQRALKRGFSIDTCILECLSHFTVELVIIICLNKYSLPITAIIKLAIVDLVMKTIFICLFHLLALLALPTPSVKSTQPRLSLQSPSEDVKILVIWDE